MIPRSSARCSVLLSCAALWVGCASTSPVASTATPPAAAAVAPSVPSAGVPFGAPTELTATLVDPINIDLKWKDNASNEAGYFVEYSPNADNEFLIIEALPPNATSYRHPRLLPHTRFVYRVRPFFGEPSNVVQFTTGAEGPAQQAAEEDNTPQHDARASLRSVDTIAAAAPTQLTVTLVPPAGVKAEWQDHAADADAYVYEIKPPWDPSFKVSGFLKPGAHSFVSYGFPFDTTFALRVRAMFYGAPSNIAEQTTGADPTLPEGFGTAPAKSASHP